uniref:Uncharacterized protein n=1 Tax=Oryza punctata TaxID=4537 RepID=A0A0E0MNC8_ORYPU
MLVGLRLLWSFAIDMDNCRVMSNTEGLLPKIMATLSSDLLHLFDHREWGDVVEASMKLGVTGVKLRREISSNTHSVTAMEGILECNECQPALRGLAVKILTQLAMDASSSFSAGSRDILVLSKSLLAIFKHWRCCLPKAETNAVVILQINGNVVSVLKEILLNSEENESRINAAEILSHLLCSRYTRDDEYLAEELKKAIMDVMPEVLKEMLQCGETGREIQTGAEADHKGRFSPPGTVDVEVQDDGNRQSTFTSSRQRNSGNTWTRIYWQPCYLLRRQYLRSVKFKIWSNYS